MESEGTKIMAKTAKEMFEKLGYKGLETNEIVTKLVMNYINSDESEDVLCFGAYLRNIYNCDTCDYHYTIIVITSNCMVHKFEITDKYKRVPLDCLEVQAAYEKMKGFDWYYND